MSNNVRYLSEIERYEIININDGEKYSGLINNDVIIDEEGKLKYLIVNLGGGKFNLFNSDEYLEIEWENVKRIGAKTIILDVDSDMIKKTKLQECGDFENSSTKIWWYFCINKRKKNYGCRKGKRGNK